MRYCAVKPFTLGMEKKDKVKLMMSMYGNEDRYTVAELLKERKELSVNEVSQITGVHVTTISRYLREMKATGLLDSHQKSYYTLYFLTDLGKKIFRAV